MQEETHAQTHKKQRTVIFVDETSSKLTFLTNSPYSDSLSEMLSESLQQQ